MSATIDQCIEAVVGSVKWLDGNRPNWYQKIDLKSFCFINPIKCIAGQLGLSYLEKHSSKGFDSPLRSDDPDFDLSYTFMESTWRVFIQKRLDNG